MKSRTGLVPVVLLASGAALTLCGLAIAVVYGPRSPVAALVVLFAGLLDGIAGLVWTLALLFPRAGDSPERREDGGRTLVLASGLLAVVFLGVVLAILLYLHVIVSCLRSLEIF
jgi:hypothetical protein